MNTQVIHMTPYPRKKVIYVAIKKELSKQDKILKEERRLRRIYKKLESDNYAIIDGLIQRAAYMRTTLDEYENDLDEGGYTEMFTQSVNTPPYERERPVARLYNTMNANYQKIIKQLNDLLPKVEPKTEDDGFDEFLMRK